MNEKEFNDIVDQFGFNDDTLDRNWDEIQARAYKFDRYDVEVSRWLLLTELGYHILMH